ncbi:replication-relaxation family protein [Streptomonospora salina]|uniref:Replication-relaxation n=1 Tax=Streptomonospora salina TaxID=104205 RepID=A0A841EBS2_9ACTN|nr:replication-relaxation family protein [Streptomonospora salina]MBB5998779.1 hypothetical protein [Streptomonospora salina]
MLSPSAAHILHLLHHHRLLTTAQVHTMATPNATTSRFALRMLHTLREEALVESVGRRGTRTPALWFATPDGAYVVEAGLTVPGRPYRMDARKATGPLMPHTLAVVDTGLAFLRHARQRGDEFDVCDWSPEIAHRYRSGGGFDDSHVIADALLNYLLVEGRRRAQMQFFIEVDRATMSLPRLAAKLVNYARYYDYVPESPPAPGGRRIGRRQPAWKSRYNRFPRLLVVFTGANPTRLENRMLDLAARLQEAPYLAAERAQFQVGGVLLDQLVEHGPTAPIFRSLLAPQEGLADFTLRTVATANQSGTI